MRTWMKQAGERAAERPGTIAAALFAAGALLVGFTLVDGGGASAARGEANERAKIATATSNGVRVRLVAVRDPSEDPPLATVRLAAFERADGKWRRLGRPRIVGHESAWFWRVVTSRYGVRQLALGMAGGRFPVRIGVRLLQSASLGPSVRFRFVVDRGRLRSVDV